MKRFIVALSLLSLVCAVMAVPVFADELVEEDYGIVLPVIPFDEGIVLPDIPFEDATDPTVPSEPDPDPGSSNFLDNIGLFFVQSFAWLGAVLNVIIQSPALLIFVVCFAVAGVIVGYIRRSKNL